MKYPILAGAMTWVSDPNLVSAVSNAGGNQPVEIFREQIEQTRVLTDKPFGVNLITIAPAYRDHLKLIREMQISYVIFAGSFPGRKDIRQVKESGARVMCFAPSRTIAHRLLSYGADAIILEGTEAGGHIGPISLIVLLQQVLFEMPEVPIFVGGGIVSGKLAAHLFLMGAAGVQMGTRFAVSEESIAHPEFKKWFILAESRDATVTPQFDSRLPVIPVRALRNAGLEDFKKLQLDLLNDLDTGTVDRKEAQQQIEKYWVGALKRAVIYGVNAVHSEGILCLVKGSYNESLTINKAMKIIAPVGTVTIGPSALSKPDIEYEYKNPDKDQAADNSIPTEFNMCQNYPNPFNVTTTIYYALKEDVKVNLKIYNIVGQEIRTLVDENQPAGYKSLIWDGNNDFGKSVPSGIYIFRINTDKFNKSLKLLMLK